MSGKDETERISLDTFWLVVCNVLFSQDSYIEAQGFFLFLCIFLSSR